VIVGIYMAISEKIKKIHMKTKQLRIFHEEEKTQHVPTTFFMLKNPPFYFILSLVDSFFTKVVYRYMVVVFIQHGAA
jgi:hypothetical protein